MRAGKISRREFLGVARSVAIAGIVAAGIVGGIAGYVGGSSAAPPKTVTQTVTGVAEPLKVGYVYIGPVGDYGWSYAMIAVGAGLTSTSAYP